MKINRIELFNFSSFEGKNVFDFSASGKGKNIILIGGKNGAGKTSLFTAIKLALYGPLSYGYQGVNPYYINKIKELINFKAFQQKRVKSYVKLDIEVKLERELRSYTITRFWNYLDQKLNEIYTVTENGNSLSEQKLSYFQNYLQGMIPPELFEFFLFDGEEIGNIFSSSTYDSYVKKAVYTLCGMDTFEIIRKYTYNYVSKAKAGDDEALYEEYETLREQGERVSAMLAQKQKEIVVYQERLQRIETELLELDIAFRRAGGITKEKKNKLMRRFKKAEEKKNDAAIQIKQFVENLMPFYIVKGFSEEITHQIAIEEQVKSYELVCNNLTSDQAKSKLKKEMNIEEGMIDQLLAGVLKVLKPSEYQKGSEMKFDLSSEEASQVKTLSLRILSFDGKRIVELVRQREEAVKTTMEIHNVLKNSMSEDDAADFTNKENTLLQEKHEVSEKLYVAQSDVSNLESEFTELTKKQEKALEDLRNNAQEKHVYELSKGLNNMMTTLLGRRTEKIRSQLECLIVDKLHEIYRKNNLISHVELTEEFQFNLYQDEIYTCSDIISLINNLGVAGFSKNIGSQGMKILLEQYGTKDMREVKYIIENLESEGEIKLYKRIDLSRLSKGERQIFILSLYWAIIELSGKNIPFIIDTPYARIDANHRREISEKFFPNISEQVIILSTDEEINEEYYHVLKPFIAKEYLLINDESENKTSVENCYFFEE